MCSYAIQFTDKEPGSIGLVFFGAIDTRHNRKVEWVSGERQFKFDALQLDENLIVPIGPLTERIGKGTAYAEQYVVKDLSFLHVLGFALVI